MDFNSEQSNRPICPTRPPIWSIAVLGLTILANDRAIAQALREQAPSQQSPKTKLEAFTGESGAVIIKGYTEVGTVRSLGSIAVSAMTFRNAKLGQENKGLSITITETGTYTRPSRAFIDYDEITELVSGIDYISKADTTLTKLANYEATYSTKGSFKITVFNNSAGQNQVNISIDSYGNGIFLKMQDLAKLRENIQAAKNILDNPDAVAAKGSRPPSPAADTAAAATSPQPAVATSPSAASAPRLVAKPKPKPTTTTPLQLNNQ
ncbi:MAG: hypothetical protein QOI05_4113 [Bradyrhizobium sp.]|jgi:hypothetical protein|nr:hypothetical protein [Bradyrhizobium sp.]